MVWLKAPAAAQHCGGICTKVLYAAVKHGELKAARIGAGRNLLFAADWLDDWLKMRANKREAS